jgi:hypothetical protein
MTPLAGLDEFRKDQTPADWRQWWFAQQHSAGFAVPHGDSGIQVKLKRAAMNRSLLGRRRAAESDSLNGIYR